MRSRFADTFNHDADASEYDADIVNEAHPIRAGYGELLNWTAQNAEIASDHRVLELGAGTGNLTRLLPGALEIVAVDISQAMLAIARSKVVGPIRWVREDLLGYFDHNAARFDRVVSTYAIHHLETDEKVALFQRIREAVNPGARVIFGDLMFESARHRSDAQSRYRTLWRDVADAIDEEFFWLLDDCIPALEQLGFVVTQRRFSDLSWGVAATLVS